jgi:hypothetical protein
MKRPFDFNTYVKDSAARIVGHGDANQSIFMENLLTETLRQLYLKRYPETPWGDGKLIDIDTSANPGANGVQWEMIGDVGLFKTVADDADDIPQIDVEGSTSYNKAITIAGAIRYSEQQLQAAEMQGMFNVASIKADAAKRAYVRTLNNYIRSGSAADSIAGMTNLPGRKNLVSTGAWSGLTPAQIQADFVRAFDAIWDGTGGTFVPDTVVFPSSVRGRLLQQNSVATNDNILNWMKQNYDMITMWEFDYGMNTSGTGSTDAMIMYVRDPLICGAIVPEYMRPLPVQPKGLSFEMPFKSRFAGIRNTNPGTVATLYGL